MTTVLAENSMLLTALESAKDSYETDFIVTVAFSRPESRIDLRQHFIADQNMELIKEKISKWLKSVELRVNPFATLDASQDPFIPFYLIDHDQYNLINGDFISFVFAPPGSGKSAFRVRLARDCRVGKDGKKIFPIVYNLPAIHDPKISSETHYKELARAAAYELLLYVLHHPSLVIDNDDLLFELQRIFDVNFYVNYLQQMVEQGSIQPLLDVFDRTARLLPNPPGEKDIALLASKLKRFWSPLFPIYKISPKQKFEQTITFIVNRLKFESVYILVDGVDAYVETGRDAENAVEAISWLLTTSDEWQKNRIFAKYFLPTDVKQLLGKRFPLLTSCAKIANIEWNNEDKLSEVIRQRLQEASGGKYSSLRAISSLPLRGAKQAPEEILAHEVVKLDNPTPRDLIKAVNRLLIHHAQHEEQEKLTPNDLKAAIDWIHSERSSKLRYA